MTEDEPHYEPQENTPSVVGDYPSAVTGTGEAASIRLDADGLIATWNGAAESLTGRPAENVRDEPVSVLFEEGALGTDGLDSVLETARRTGHVETAVRCVQSSGATFPASVTITPCQQDSNQQYTMVLRDERGATQLEDERRLLAEVSRDVARADSFTDGIETALAAVCAHTQWAYGEAWTPAEDGSYLKHVVGHAEDPALEEFKEDSESVTFQSGEGLPGRVYASGMPEWIPDTSDEPEEVFHRTELTAAVGLRAALCVPVMTDDRVVAVLAFFLREYRDADDRLVEVVTDIAADLGGLMARKQTEDALTRERAVLGRIFETSPVGLLVTATDGTVERANRQAGKILGYETDSLIGQPFGSVVQFRNGDGEPVPDGELPTERALVDCEPIENVELQFRRNGETVWVSVSAAPIQPEEGGIERITVAIDDITERREREQSLRTFQEAIEHAGHSIYVTDTDGTIQYVNPAFEEMTGYSAEEAIGQTPSILNSGEHDREFFADLWGTILDGEVWTGEVINERKSGQRYVINQTIAPIVDEAGEIERFVAVNDEITEQKRRERTLRRQRNSLERIQQIIESHRPINRELARAGTREEIDRVVCEQLAASDAYLFAWIGGYNRATEEIDPHEWAGVEEAFVRDIDLSVGTDDLDRGPFDRAVTDREVGVLQEVPTDPGAGAWRDRAIEYGFQSIAAVPVTYGETVLGVIGVYSARPNAFDKYERGLLRELGERIGHAINAAENKQLLHTDTLVEVEFDVGVQDSPMASVAANLGCRLSVTNVTPTADMTYLSYVEVDGAPPESVVESLDGRSEVSRARVVESRGETGVVELTVGTGPMSALLEQGATIRSYDATGEGGTLIAEIAPQSDVAALITDIEATYGETEFVAKRTITQKAATVTKTKTAVEDVLTDRQREVLALAYHAGFFESPRHSTGEELAEALGISAPTFYQHVRTAVHKLLRLLVETEDFQPPPEQSSSVALSE